MGMDDDYIVIRDGRREDAPYLKRIAGEAYRQYLPRMPKPPAPMLADYDKHLADDSVLVAEAATAIRTIIGFAIIICKSDGYWLENIAVGDGWRGRGIGGRLLGAVEASLDGKAAYYQLYTNAVMTENIVWYRRLGFEDSGEREDEGYTRVFFKKSL